MGNASRFVVVLFRRIFNGLFMTEDVVCCCHPLDPPSADRTTSIGALRVRVVCSTLQPRTYLLHRTPGMNVMFHDESGNELKRQATHHVSSILLLMPRSRISVDDFSDSEDPDLYDEALVELTDEYGHLVYKRVF